MGLRRVQILICSVLILVVFRYSCLRRAASAFTNKRPCYLVAGEDMIKLNVHNGSRLLPTVTVTPSVRTQFWFIPPRLALNRVSIVPSPIYGDDG